MNGPEPSLKSTPLILSNRTFYLRLNNSFLNWNHYLIVYRWETRQHHNCRFQNSRDSWGFLCTTNNPQGLAHLPKQHFLLSFQGEMAFSQSWPWAQGNRFYPRKSRGDLSSLVTSLVSKSFYLHAEDDLIPIRDWNDLSAAEFSLHHSWDIPEWFYTEQSYRKGWKMRKWDRKSFAGRTEMGRTQMMKQQLNFECCR